jgi:hypothetical protein
LGNSPEQHTGEDALICENDDYASMDIVGLHCLALSFAAYGL